LILGLSSAHGLSGVSTSQFVSMAVAEKLAMLQAEVADFVDFLRARKGETRLTAAAAKASEASFAQVMSEAQARAILGL
jgi:hypothetical protein